MAKSKVIKVRYIKNDKYAYEVDEAEDIKVNGFVLCKVADTKGGAEYEQLAIVTDICDEEEAEKIRKQLAVKKMTLKTARKFIKARPSSDEGK